MARPKGSAHLAEETIWAIVQHPEMPAPALGRLLGLSESTVRNRRWEMREHGWSCSVEYKACLACGETVTVTASMSRKFPYHRDCRPGALKAINSRLDKERWRSLSPEQKATKLDAAHEFEFDKQQELLDKATNQFARWTEDEEAFLLQNRHRTAYVLAEELGRSLYAVRMRIAVLRRRGLIE